jgi:hypothetical protein
MLKPSWAKIVRRSGADMKHVLLDACSAAKARVAWMLARAGRGKCDPRRTRSSAGDLGTADGAIGGEVVRHDDAAPAHQHHWHRLSARFHSLDRRTAAGADLVHDVRHTIRLEMRDAFGSPRSASRAATATSDNVNTSPPNTSASWVRRYPTLLGQL